MTWPDPLAQQDQLQIMSQRLSFRPSTALFSPKTMQLVHLRLDRRVPFDVVAYAHHELGLQQVELVSSSTIATPPTSASRTARRSSS
jgi:hypothetical protein